MHSLLIFCCLTFAARLSSAALTWGKCPSDVPLASAALQCAQLQVPLNWTESGGQNITLGLTRVQANDTANRIGSLVINPGGPGEPASTLIAGQALGFTLFSKALSDRFDIVGMDPRGVGISTPVFCDPKLWNERVSYFPTTEAEYNTMTAHNEAVWKSCADMTGPLLYNVDTLSVTRDLEAVREALDEEQLNYLGLSYGSLIGQTYAKLYPDKYRAIALDAIVNHNESGAVTFAIEASTYERELDRFAEWCNNSTDCALHGENVTSIFDTLISNATKKAIPAPGCEGGGPSYAPCRQNVTGEEILFAVQQLLTFKDPFPPQFSGWAGLSQMFATAAQGNATALSQAYGSQYLATSNRSDVFSGLATTCLDFDRSIQSFSDLQGRLELGAAVAPLTKGASQTWGYQTQCIGFGHAPTYPQTDMSINNNASTAILLAQSVYDPSCSVVSAIDVKEEIANVSLALRDGDGHTSYYLHGDLAGIIDTYLINGTVPKAGTVVSS
jgi:pimeloyl-ACP methyl ester carboxylesterase